MIQEKDKKIIYFFLGAIFGAIYLFIYFKLLLL